MAVGSIVALLAEVTGGSQGARDIVVNLARRDNLTVRQILDRVITWHRLVVGSPERIADAIEEWYLAGAVDGRDYAPSVESIDALARGANDDNNLVHRSASPHCGLSAIGCAVEGPRRRLTNEHQALPGDVREGLAGSAG